MGKPVRHARFSLAIATMWRDARRTSPRWMGELVGVGTPA